MTPCFCGENNDTYNRCESCNIPICTKCEKYEFPKKNNNSVCICVSCYYKRKGIRLLKKIWSKLECPDSDREF